jgi:hypothetical protein
MTANSKPTETQVTEFISQCEATLDGVLSGLGYVTPVTGTESLKIVKKITTDGAAFYAMSAAFSGVSPNKSDQATDYRLQWKEAIKDLKDGKMILSDAPKTDEALGEPQGTGAVSSFAEVEKVIADDKEWG